eukprot:10005189-Alexandrium_andersonii.AAC.1
MRMPSSASGTVHAAFVASVRLAAGIGACRAVSQLLGSQFCPCSCVGGADRAAVRGGLGIGLGCGLASPG